MIALLLAATVLAQDLAPPRKVVGKILRAKGEIKWARPEPGTDVPIAAAKDKSLAYPEPFTIVYAVPEQDRDWREPPPLPPQKLKDGRLSFRRKKLLTYPLTFGEIFRLEPVGRLEFVLPDDTILEAGPGAHFELTGFEGTGQERKLKIRFLLGKFHVSIPQAKAKAVFETPNAILFTRKPDSRYGHQFFLELGVDGERVSSTSVTMIHGTLTADSVKTFPNGKTFIDTQVFAPSTVMTIRGRHGLNEETAKAPIPEKDLAALIARLRELR